MLLRRYIERIEVGPAVPGRNRYDADRVSVVFTDGSESFGPHPSQIRLSWTARAHRERVS